jgi:hypothetical protein
MKTLNKLAVSLVLATFVAACSSEQTITVTPGTATLDQGATQAFTAEAKGVKDIVWSVQGGGTITPNGVLTAPNASGTVVVVAQSAKNETKVGTATITVRSVDVQVTPATALVAQGAAQTFTAAVTGTVNKAVKWSVGQGSVGSINADTGVFTAGNAPGSATIIATSVADGSRKAIATVTIPATQGLAYTNPTATSGWRLVKNTAASSAFHLVLDLVGPADTNGRGVSLTLQADSDNVAWAKVDGADAELVANHAFQLGNGAQLIKGSAKGQTLSAGVFQKEGAPVAVSSAVVSVALDLSAKAISSVKPGTAIPLTVVKASALPEAGALAPITVAVGSVVAQ